MSIYNMRLFAWMLWQSGHSLLQKTEKTFFSWYHKGENLCMFWNARNVWVCVCVSICVFVCLCLYLCVCVWVSFLRDVEIKWSLKFREEVVCFCSLNLQVTRLLVRISLAFLWAPKTVTSIELCELFLCTWWDTHFGFFLPFDCI